MEKTQLSLIESCFIKENALENQTTNIPYITVDNFPDLGLITSLRFLEWVLENPGGVISLPTGKTPEYFIKWTHYLLKNWDDDAMRSILKEYGLTVKQKPDLTNLHFVPVSYTHLTLPTKA